MTTDLRLIARAALSAIVALAACDGGSRLGVAVDSYTSVEDADTVIQLDTEGGETAEHRDTMDADTALDTLTPVDCLGGGSCGDQAYCSYPDGHCKPVTAQCENGWCILPAARFMMGSDGVRGPNQNGFEPTRHPVVLTHRVRMQATETTVQQWEDLMGPLTESGFPACGIDCPALGGTTTAKLAYANMASVRDGVEACYSLEGCEGKGDRLFCEDVTYRGLLCKGYRLPTEAESEFASRAGREYCFDPGASGPLGDRAAWSRCTLFSLLDEHEWYCANSDVTYAGGRSCDDQTSGHEHRRCGPHPIGLKLPNAFGLLDIGGNAPEMTTTLLYDYPSSTEIDPGHSGEIPSDQSLVWHGGGWSSQPIGTCPTLRGQLFPRSDIPGYIGFRLVQTLFDDD